MESDNGNGFRGQERDETLKEDVISCATFQGMPPWNPEAEKQRFGIN